MIAYVEDEETQRMVLGRYLDSHEKRDGVWRLTKRVYSLEGEYQQTQQCRTARPSYA